MRTIPLLSLALIATAAAAATREPTPAKLIAGSISDEDYPLTAAAREEEGLVIARYTVETDGRVNQCYATAMDEAPAVEAVTCVLIKERFKFTPARDEAGKAIQESKTQRVIWRLPRRAPDQRELPLPFRPSSFEAKFTVQPDGTVTECEATGRAPNGENATRFCAQTKRTAPFKDETGEAAARRVTITSSVRVDAVP